MAITLGKDGTTPPKGAGIITATYTEEKELVDITNRSNCGGTTGNPGYRISKAGLTSKTWEIECHDATGLITDLETNAATGFQVMSVTENVSIEGAITYSVTCREG